MVNENEVCHDHGAGALDVGEVADRGVHGVEAVAHDVEGEIVEGEPLHSRYHPRVRFQLIILVDLPVKGDAPGSRIDDRRQKGPKVFLLL